MRDTVSGAIAIPKASWGCAPALPNLLQLVFLGIMFHVKQCIKTSCFFRQLAANTKPQANKSFLIQQFFKNVGEVWASSPRLRSKLFLQSVFPAAIACFETVQFKQD